VFVGTRRKEGDKVNYTTSPSGCSSGQWKLVARGSEIVSRADPVMK